MFGRDTRDKFGVLVRFRSGDFFPNKVLGVVLAEVMANFYVLN
jgi:hypothetical protein